ncbi:MAG: carbohydrate ABC transporter permease [Chloroflexia bacterium]|nr:carbohydrate ABC transporter permease [Chloroflexia bacterium]
MAATPQRSRAHGTGIFWRPVFYLVLTVISVVTVLPFVFMASTSLTESFTMLSYPPRLVPDNANLQNYYDLVVEFQGGLFPRWFLNSVVTTAAITAGSVLLNTLAGYVFAKKVFVGRSLLFALILSTLMVPAAVRLIPTFQLVRSLNLYDSYGAIILPALASPIGVFMMRQFITGLPTELLEAAKIDGAGELRIFVQIVMPLSKPAMAALAILTAVTAWNDLLWPLIVLPTATLRTLTVGLATLGGQFQVNYGMVMAGSVLSVLPMVVLYMLFQRQFVEGLRTGYGK